MDKYAILQPSIEISSITSTDDILKTWVDSRSKFLELRENDVYNHETNESLGNKENYLKEVMKMDLAFNYFQNAIFKLKTSVLLRDFFYTFNEVKAKWATTQRYSTEKNMRCSKEAYQGSKTDRAFEIFQKATDDYNNGIISQFDRVREKMPLAFQVSYQFSCPIKQFIKMCSALLTIVGESSPIWREFYVALNKIPQIVPWLDKLIKYQGTDECTKYNLDSTVNDSFDKDLIDRFTHVEMGPVLYSQFIRHEGVTILGYPEFMKRFIIDDSIINCSHQFSTAFHLSKSRLLQIIRTRTEWFAVYDDWNSHNTWAAILKKFIPEGAQIEDYKKYLKVFNSRGQFDMSLAGIHDIDDSLRLHKGYNAYLPNALVLESRDIVLERIRRYGNNPVTDLYLQLFDKGYVNDNPNNPYRLKWESLNSEDKN